MVPGIAAVVLLTVGTALELWAAAVLGWRRAVDVEDEPPDPALPRLVFAGPFAIVRHPQSLGLLLILAGAAFAFRSPGMWVFAGLAGCLVVAMAVRHDSEMARQFGEAYARYRRVVPLLLPGVRRPQ